MNYSIKARIYPNKEQKSLLAELFGCYRFTYNQCLAFRKNLYEEDKARKDKGEEIEKRPSIMSQMGKLFHGTLRKEKEFLLKHNTKVLKQAIRNLDAAYQGFFKGNTGFPKFKSKSDKQTARFPVDAVSKNTFDEEGSRLSLTKTIFGLKFECSNRDKQFLFANKDKICSITMSKNAANEYHASILVDAPIQRKTVAPKGDFVGIDLGVKTLLVISNGEEVGNPKLLQKSERQLKRLQRNISKKVKGSKNRKRASLLYARKHQQVKNQKRDFIHKMTTRIVDENQVIILEDLNVAGMVKNHKLAKAIQEASFAEIKRQISYKANWHGRTVVLVDTWFPSSKLCSECGWKHPSLTLKDREFQCQGCGICLDRDLNAAINIENEGKSILAAFANGDVGFRMENSVIRKVKVKRKRVAKTTQKEKNMEQSSDVGHRLPEFTLVDCPPVGLGNSGFLGSSGRLKQEIGTA